MSKQTAQTAIQEKKRHNREDYEKCLEAFEKASCELCDIVGSLMVLDGYMQECDPLTLDKEDFYPVFRCIEQTISSTTEGLTQMHKAIVSALGPVR